MRQEPTGGKFAEENRREGHRILQRVAQGTAAGPLEVEGARRAVEVTEERMTRPLLGWREYHSQRRWPQPPAPTESPVAAAIREKTERALAINAELVQQPHRKAELEHERDLIAAELETLRSAP